MEDQHLSPLMAVAANDGWAALALRVVFRSAVGRNDRSLFAFTVWSKKKKSIVGWLIHCKHWSLIHHARRTAQGQTAHCFIGHLHRWQSDLLFKGKIQKKQIDSKVARIKATFSDLESIRTINDWDTLHTHIISVISDWLIRIVKWIIIEHIRSYIHSKSIQVDHLRIKSVRRWK